MNKSENSSLKKAVVLLSGGLDSATCLAIAKAEGFEPYALSFDYQQRHSSELAAAQAIARAIGVAAHQILAVDLRSWGGSALTSDDLQVPENREIDPGEVPVTYVPARNLIFLSLATAYAEALGARDIFIGVNSVDYSGYPDCRSAFIRAFAEAARLGTCACDENWQFTIQEAGNICWSLWELAGKKGEKQMFNTPFSQFVKASTQFVHGYRLRKDHWIYSRIASGAAHAYGNSTQVPYSEQFYVGGANSVRAFTVRSIGPGSYRDPNASANDYFDQTGTFKFEMNLEYRFPIYSALKGAMFIDAGNVWLLENDSERQGGQLKSDTFFKDLALGTGLGLRFDIDMLVVRGDLGIGIHAPYETGYGGYYNMESFRKSLAFHLAIGYPF